MVKGERCMILTLKKVFTPHYYQTISTSSKGMFPYFRQIAQCIILSKSGAQFDDSQDFGVEKREKSNTCHEMCAPCGHMLFFLL